MWGEGNGGGVGSPSGPPELCGAGAEAGGARAEPTTRGDFAVCPAFPRRAEAGGSALPPGLGLGLTDAGAPLARQRSGNVFPVPPSAPHPEAVGDAWHRFPISVRGVYARAGLVFGVRSPRLFGARQPLVASAVCGVKPFCHMLGNSSLDDCSQWSYVIMGKSDQS